MKKLSTIKLVVLTGLILSVISCSKNNGEDVSRFALPNAANFKDLRAAALQDLVHIETFKAEDGIYFTSAKGARLRIWNNCLEDQAGSAAAGDVTLSFVEIYDRGNMVAANKPLMGINEDGKKEPLITGGQFNIEVKQDDKVLRSSGCYFTLEVPADNTGGLDSDMSYWKGSINANGDLEWEEDKGEEGRERPLNPNEQRATYDIFAQDFGWANVDRFMSYSGPKTQIKVTVPNGYNHTNSGVFLAYEDSPYTLAQLDSYDTAGKFFTEHYGFVPVGLNVHVIFTSESNGEIVYAIKQVTVANGSTVAISENELNTTTKNNLVNLINALN